MIKLHYSYRKTCGLPGYSSASASAEVEVELGDLNDLERTCSDLYSKLQEVVDRELADRPGFVPEHGYGMDGKTVSNGSANRTNGNGHTKSNGEAWACSDKQRELIIKLVDEHGLDKGQIDDTSRDMFGVGVRELNKLQASGLIDRIIEDNGGKPANRRPRNGTMPQRRQYQSGGAR